LDITAFEDGTVTLSRAQNVANNPHYTAQNAGERGSYRHNVESRGREEKSYTTGIYAQHSDSD